MQCSSNTQEVPEHVPQYGVMNVLMLMKDDLNRYVFKLSGQSAEQINFLHVLSALFAVVVVTVHQVFGLITGVVPLVTMFTHLAQFALDRGLDIASTKHVRDFGSKSLVFAFQICLLATVFWLLFVVYMPTLQLEVAILTWVTNTLRLSL